MVRRGNAVLNEPEAAGREAASGGRYGEFAVVRCRECGAELAAEPGAKAPPWLDQAETGVRATMGV
jgi:hypothetical protein